MIGHRSAYDGGQRAPSAPRIDDLRERTSDDRAEHAANVAGNLARTVAAVEHACDELATATTAADHAAARSRADRNVAALRQLAQVAATMRDATTDPAVAQALAAAPEQLASAELALAAAPTPPSARPAITAGVERFAAALPALDSPPRQAHREQLHALLAVVDTGLQLDDLAPLTAALTDDTPVRQRFARLAQSVRTSVLDALHSPRLRARLVVAHNDRIAASRRSPSRAPTASALAFVPDPSPHPTATASAAAAATADPLAAAARAVSEAVVLSFLPDGAIGHLPQQIARALDQLDTTLRAERAPLDDDQRRAVHAALHAAQSYVTTAGPGPGKLVHPQIVKVTSAAAARGYRVDVIAELALPGTVRGGARDDLDATIARSQRQMARAAEQLATWGIPDDVIAPMRRYSALAWAASTPAGLGASGATRAVLQGRTLFEAASAIDELLELAARYQLEPGSRERAAFDKVLTAYARAMVASELDGDPLAAARFEQQRLPLALTRAALVGNTGSLGELAAVDAASGRAMAARQDAIADRTLALANDLRDGEAVDASAVAEVGVDTSELMFRTRTLTMEGQLEALARAAEDADRGWVAFFANAYNIEIKQVPTEVRGHKATLANFRQLLDDQTRAAIARITATDPAERRRAIVQARSDALATIEARIGSYLQGGMLQRACQRAVHAIDDAHTRAIVTELIGYTALAIALSAASGGVASVVGRGVTGALGGTTAIVEGGAVASGLVVSANAVRTARLVGVITQVATDAAINTVGQQLVLGDQASWTAAFTSNAAVSAALRPLHGVFARWSSTIDPAEVRSMKLWQGRGAMVLRGGIELSVEAISGAAIDYAVKRVAGERARGLDEATASEWLLNGASMAIGRFLSGRLTDLEQRWGAAAEREAYLAVSLRKARTLALAVEGSREPAHALDAVIAYHQVLEAEQLAITTARADHTVDAATLDHLQAGHDTAAAAITSAAFEQLPLRLAGLEPDSASGTVWSGASEDIAPALRDAERAGIAVEVVVRGDRLRTWQVRYGGRLIEIAEVARVGVPRKARKPRGSDDVRRADEYAATARALHAKALAAVKADLDARPFAETDHLQVGYSIAGVINQARLPESGVGLGRSLVVYSDDGTLATRGDQDLGQAPSAYNAPGLRGEEHAEPDARWMTSGGHARSLDVARYELQTPAYHGRVVALEPRPAQPPADWAAPTRAWRARVTAADGHTLWVYADRVDNAGGMGPARLSAIEAVVPAEQLAAMRAAGKVIVGADVDFASKLDPAARRILIWGGSPTGAWAAEVPGKIARGPAPDVTILGDQPRPVDWPAQFARYTELERQIAALEATGGAAAALIAARREEMGRLEATVRAAHAGSTLPRNRAPGAAFNNPDIAVEFGTPAQIDPQTDGSLRVTIRAGAVERVAVYDQIVMAHGQDVGGPGGPASLLGAPAAKDAEVPAGTIALRPILSADGLLLGVESIDPPGLRLIGAAGAMNLSPWIARSERAAYDAATAKLRAMRDTRDHGTISADSPGVTVGIEFQRDLAPRANEQLAAEAYALPGLDRTLTLTSGQRPQWGVQVERFLAERMRVEVQHVHVVELGADARAVRYRVTVGDHDAGVLRVFTSEHAAETEQSMLELLEHAQLKRLRVVHQRGVVGVDAGGEAHGAIFTDEAKGQTVGELARALPTGAGRKDAMIKLRAAVDRTAEGLAELTATSRGNTIAAEDRVDRKLAVAEVVARLRDPAIVAKLGGVVEAERLATAIKAGVGARFIDANLPSSAMIGTASQEHFALDGWDSKSKTFASLTSDEAGGMAASLDTGGDRNGQLRGRVAAGGAGDALAYRDSLLALATENVLPSDDADALVLRFDDRYRRNLMKLGVNVSSADLTTAQTWHALRAAIDGVVAGDDRATSQLKTLAGLPTGASDD